jgi:hypothetical protein
MDGQPTGLLTPITTQYPFGPTPGRNPNLTRVDPRLIQAVKLGSAYLPAGYRVQINEGYNPNGHAPGSQHHNAGSGALDVQIVDAQGNVIPNRGADASGLYTQLAKGSYTAAQGLGVGDRFAWGGRFATVPGGSTPDLMHFDLGGDRGRFLQPLAKLFGVSPPQAPPAPTPPQYTPNTVNKNDPFGIGAAAGYDGGAAFGPIAAGARAPQLPPGTNITPPPGGNASQMPPGLLSPGGANPFYTGPASGFFGAGNGPWG